MEQAKNSNVGNKLFRNCPYPKRHGCENCPRLGWCVCRKIDRRLRKRLGKLGRNMLYLAVIVCAIIMAVAIFKLATYSCQTTQPNTTPNLENFIDPSKITVVKMQGGSGVITTTSTVLETDAVETELLSRASMGPGMVTSTMTVETIEAYSEATAETIIEDTAEMTTKTTPVETLPAPIGPGDVMEETETPTVADVPETAGSEEMEAATVEIAQIVMPSAFGPYEFYIYEATPEERKMLEKIIYAEAGNQPLKGKVSIGSTVINRKLFGNPNQFDTRSLVSIIVQKRQFADISGITQEMLDSNPECALAAELALRGWDPTREHFPEGALYFYNPKIVKGYQKKIREGIDYFQIEDHNFHRNFDKVR